MFIQYGLKIITNQTGLTAYNLGLLNGVLKWATGRADLGEYKNGIVLKDSFTKVSQAVAISASGSYGTMSGFSLEIDNSNGIVDLIRDLGLNLIQADSSFYSFRRETSEDDWEETQDWAGKVLDLSYDESKIKIQFMDSFRGVHKPLLKKVFTKNEFADSPDLIDGKPIPVSIGLVSKSKLYPVVKREVLENICTIGSVEYNIAPCTNYADTGNGAYKVYTLTLKTGDKVIAANALIGKYLISVKGGSESIPIRSNLVSAAGVTVLTISGPLSGTPVYWSATSVDVWYFQVTSLAISYLAAQHPVYEFKLNSENRSSIFAFDSTLKTYDDVSEIGTGFDTEEAVGVGYPGCSVISKPLDVEGNVFYKKFGVLPEVKKMAASVTGLSPITGTNTAIAVGADLPNLHDQANLTGYTWICDVTTDTEFLTIPFKVPLNKDWVTSNFSNFYLAFNHKLDFDTVTDFIVYLNVKLCDYLGRVTEALDTVDRIIYAETVNGFWENVDNLIEGEYGSGFLFGSIFNNIKSLLAVNNDGSNNIIKPVDIDVYPYVIFELKYRWRQLIGTSVMTVNIREITLVGEKSLNLLSDNLYTAMQGAVFGTTWESRKTAANPVKNIADVAELLIRVFDNAPEVIDTVSFDLLSNPTTGTLRNFYVGQQIQDEINTADLIDELCRFGFFGIVPKNNGKRAAKSWLDGTSVATHNDGNGTIVENTIGEKKPTSLADVFNEPQVNYGYNPETKSYDGILKMARLEEAEFPIEADLDWKTYAIGYETSEYDEAKENWDLCKLSVTRYGLRRALPSEMSDAKWFPNVEKDWGLTATYNAAKAYMRRLCRWTAFRKDVVPYQLPNTAEHATLELLDKITFSDSTDRGGAEIDGWIVRKAIVPGLGKDYIEIDLMLEPDLGGLG